VANASDPKSSGNDSQVLLIAQLRAFLVSGESFDLLPIKHEQDVKTEVESLVQSWAESGFLVHGRFIYSWHQVKQVEVTEVEKMPLQLAHSASRSSTPSSAHARRKTSGVLAARPRRA
jgi:hypothetical protein